MPSPAWEDLDVFFDVDDFAEQATLTVSGTPRSILGIFDDPYEDAEAGEFHRDIKHSFFWCKESDAGDASRGDTLTVHGKTYDILTWPQSDGTGVVKIPLAPQPPG